MTQIRKIFQQHKSIILYLLFGVCTTALNIISYQICYSKLQASNISSTIIAWVIAVLFAFFTNKLYVFNSRSWTAKLFIYELLTFWGCRFLTGILDVLVMYFAVDIMKWQPIIWKAISNVLIIILNYIASKLIIFSQGQKHSGKDEDILKHKEAYMGRKD